MSARKQKFRQTEVARLTRGVTAAGIPVKEIKVMPDGSLVAVIDWGTGQPPTDTSWDDLKTHTHAQDEKRPS
jgi:hypothetical protein